MATQTRNNKKFQGPPADNYAALVATLPPRPLHDKHDYENAVEMMGRLIGYDLNRDQQDYLEALGVFVDQYEAAHQETQLSTDHVGGLRLLKSLMDDHNMSGADLARLLGASRSLGPMILRGERAITAEHARILGNHFKLDAGLFIRAESN